MNKQTPWKQITVDANNVPIRLDKWIAQNEPLFSRRAAVKMIAAGQITVNNKTVTKNTEISDGQIIEFWTKPALANWAALRSLAIDINVVYEDEYLAIVEKPSKLSSIPLKPDESETLAGAVLNKFAQCKNIGRQPGDTGLLQRLDFETSGLVIVAKKQSCFNQLLAMQKNHEIIKNYLALVPKNSLPPQIIKQPLGTASKSSKTVKVIKTGTLVKTIISTVAIYEKFMLLEATIEKGFRHQIRVHLAYVNLPLVGDKLYGGPQIFNLKRLFLHASKLEFKHPVTNKFLKITSMLPPELQSVIDNI